MQVMARTRRCEVFDADNVGVYHCYNRIVRRSFLCGVDPHTGNDYSHRREWLYQRLKFLAKYFAIDVLGYAILSNHYHLVLRNRPDHVKTMSDDQVVRAWLMICPRSQKRADGNAGEPTDGEVRFELQQTGRVQELRERLANPSWLIRQLSQYMGIRCNAEDQIRGHFWESRFGMRRLLDEAAVLACLAYVDLNPIRAGMVDSLEDYAHVSIGERLRAVDDQPIEWSTWLAPLELAGETDREPVTVVNQLLREELGERLATQQQQPLGCLPMTLGDYAELLRWLSGKKGGHGSSGRDAASPSVLRRLKLDPAEFAELVSHFSKRFFTAAGCPASLAVEAKRRGRTRLNGPGKRSLSHCGGG
jgi:hypothetical protein